MNTEKRTAILAAIEASKKRLRHIDALRSIGAATRAQEFERDQIIELIRTGEQLLASSQKRERVMPLPNHGPTGGL